jgi:hypothetical protein
MEWTISSSQNKFEKLNVVVVSRGDFMNFMEEAIKTDCHLVGPPGLEPGTTC